MKSFAIPPRDRKVRAPVSLATKPVELDEEPERGNAAKVEELHETGKIEEEEQQPALGLEPEQNEVAVVETETEPELELEKPEEIAVVEPETELEPEKIAVVEPELKAEAELLPEEIKPLGGSVHDTATTTEEKRR